MYKAATLEAGVASTVSIYNLPCAKQCADGIQDSFIRRTRHEISVSSLKLFIMGDFLWSRRGIAPQRRHG